MMKGIREQVESGVPFWVFSLKTQSLGCNLLNLLTGYFVITVVYILQNEEKSLMYVALLFS